LLEIPEAAICCGSAEIYNLVQPEAATQLGDRKAAHVAALDADMVVSGNPPAACCSAAAPVCPPARGAKAAGATSSSCLMRLSAAFLYDVGALPALLGSLLRL
jgi:Fe-S oxidoreductase